MLFKLYFEGSLHGILHSKESFELFGIQLTHSYQRKRSLANLQSYENFPIFAWQQMTCMHLDICSRNTCGFSAVKPLIQLKDIQPSTTGQFFLNEFFLFFLIGKKMTVHRGRIDHCLFFKDTSVAVTVVGNVSAHCLDRDLLQQGTKVSSRGS